LTGLCGWLCRRQVDNKEVYIGNWMVKSGFVGERMALNFVM